MTFHRGERVVRLPEIMITIPWLDEYSEEDSELFKYVPIRDLIEIIASSPIGREPDIPVFQVLENRINLECIDQMNFAEWSLVIDTIARRYQLHIDGLFGNHKVVWMYYFLSWVDPYTILLTAHKRF